MKFLAAAILSFVAVTASAQEHFAAVPQAPPLAADTFALIAPTTLQSSNFSAGWDSIAAVTIGENRLLRLFYRKFDGLTVAVIEDTHGAVLAQSRIFTMLTGADVLNLTLVTRDEAPYAWDATVVVFAYNRTTGIAGRKSLVWNAAIR